MQSVESRPTFRRNMLPSYLLANCFRPYLLLDLFLTLKMEGPCSSEISVEFNELHGVTCQQL
jgi:hypothetical protein